MKTHFRVLLEGSWSNNLCFCTTGTPLVLLHDGFVKFWFVVEKCLSFIHVSPKGGGLKWRLARVTTLSFH